MATARELYTVAYREIRSDEKFYRYAWQFHNIGAISAREMAFIKAAKESWLRADYQSPFDRFDHAYRAFRGRMSPALLARVRSEVFKPLAYAA